MAPDAKRARWMDYLERVNPGYLRTRELGNSYNDWLAPADDKTPTSCSPASSARRTRLLNNTVTKPAPTRPQ
jgi:hypothetical protein